jgi:hypothetical protein
MLTRKMRRRRRRGRRRRMRMGRRMAARKNPCPSKWRSTYRHTH